MLKDSLFEREYSQPGSFKFDAEVSAVFDDMVQRSVPLYTAIQDLLTALTLQYFQTGTAIYDLGCSTGESILKLLNEPALKDANFVALDYSPEMLDKAKQRLSHLSAAIAFKQGDLETGCDVKNASVVLLNLVLQFTDPKTRPATLKAIYDGLNRGGALLLVEKVCFESESIQEQYTTLYYDYKKARGYSQNEIKQKELSLEGVLRPHTIDYNKTLLLNAGFSTVETFFQCYNFVGFLALK